jgi:hypothetical protein
MNAGRGTGSFRKVGDRYDGYTVVDADGEKTGTLSSSTSERLFRASVYALGETGFGYPLLAAAFKRSTTSVDTSLNSSRASAILLSFC